MRQWLWTFAHSRMKQWLPWLQKASPKSLAYCPFSWDFFYLLQNPMRQVQDGCPTAQATAVTMGTGDIE